MKKISRVIFVVSCLLLAASLTAGLCFSAVSGLWLQLAVSVLALLFSAAAGIFGFMLLSDNKKELIDSAGELELMKSRMDIYMRDRVLVRLLFKDDYSENWRDSELKKYGVSFPKSKNVVGVFSLDDYPEEYETEMADTDVGVDNYVYSEIREVCELVFSQTPVNAVLTVRYEGFVIILNYEPDELGSDKFAVKNQLKRYMRCFLETLERRNGIFLSVCMGREADGVSEIAHSFSTALAAKEYKTIVGLQEREVEYNTDDASKNKFISDAAKTSYKSISLEKHFMSSIEKHDFENARTLLEEIIKNEFTPLPPVEIAKMKMHGILYIIFRSVESLRMNTSEESWPAFTFEMELLNAENVVQIEQLIKSWFDELTSGADVKSIDSRPEWLDGVVEYINEFYRDSSLNINILADRFDFSSSYLSKTFRKYMNTSIADYIQVRRINSAKSCLEAGQTVMEAATNSGFASTRTMSRLFVKYEGVTPGKYTKSAE